MFEIRKLKNKKHPFLVVANSYDNPLSCLKSIAERLHKEAFKGSVIFDLLCSNGLESNRFVTLDFDGEAFIRGSFSVVDQESIPKKIIDEQNVFFANHPSMLKNSVLSNNEISMITSCI